MSRNIWWIIALLLAVLSFDNFLQALNWFHDDDDKELLQRGNADKQTDDDSLFEKAKNVVENVASSGKKAKDTIEDKGKRAASSISHKYEEAIARPFRHWTAGKGLRGSDEDFWNAMSPWSHWFDSSRPWTHSVASLGQFRTFPNEYIVYLDLPGVPKEEIEIFVRGHRLRVHGTHGTCLAGSGEIDRFCLERQVDRSFSVPEDVIVDHIEGLLKDGVLMLKLPRLQEEEEEEEDSEEGDEGDSGFFGRSTKLKGKKIHVKDYKPTWRERAREASEAVKDTFKKTKK
jgi:HSP20 family molecular chaperone IbpA